MSNFPGGREILRGSIFALEARRILPRTTTTEVWEVWAFPDANPVFETSPTEVDVAPAAEAPLSTSPEVRHTGVGAPLNRD